MDGISREIESYLLRLSEQYPVVTVTGPRQAGKTTLCKRVFPYKPYVSLENLDVRAEAVEDPNGFLRKFPDGAIFDEIQRVPNLFSYIQTYVDSVSRNGFFILTGSQNFQLLHAVSQSLAGRTALLTLLPFSTSELPKEYAALSLETLLYRGFYPRVYKEGLDPTEAMAFYTATYLERDIRELIHVKNLGTFGHFLRACAGRTGQVLNIQSLSNECDISFATAKEWLSVLETSYILTRVSPHYQNLNKRLTKAPKLHFMDSGLVCYLLGISSPDQLLHHPLKGHIFESFVVVDLMKHHYNRARQPRFYYFRENNNHEIDLLMEDGPRLLPIEIKSSETASSHLIKNLEWYQKHNSLVDESYLVYAGQQERKLGSTQVYHYLHSHRILS
jgi:predicted AAA+ superfamily ATPase